MKVYELVEQLAKMPAGAVVRFRRLIDSDELAKYPDDPEFYEASFEIREATLCNGTVDLDGLPQ